MKQIRLIISLLLISVMGTAYAQVVSPVDFMRNNSRASFANPAFFSKDYGYFDFGLGGINIGFQNIGLKYDSFFRYNAAGQPQVLDLDNGLARLRDKNYLNTFLNIDVFNCGRRTKYGFFTYSHRIREWESLRYSKDLVKLIAAGNGSFVGANSADIDIALSVRAVQEFNFGYQMCLTDKLNIGARVKFLMGITDARTGVFNLQLNTDADSYALRLMADMNAKASLPYKIEEVNGWPTITDRRFNMANLFKNYGAGIDLGAEYIINDQFGVAAAINDLGFISWKNNTAQFHAGFVDGGSMYQNGGLVFEGLSNEAVNAILDDADVLKQYIDTLKQCIDVNLTTGVRYTTGLNTSLMVRGYYDLTPEHRFSAQLMGFATGIGMKPAMTLAYTGSFGDNYDVVATYTMMPGSYDNLGIGLSANFGGFIMYVASNNILGFFNSANITQTNLQFGLAFSGGGKTKRSDTILLK